MKRVIQLFIVAMIGGLASIGTYKYFEKEPANQVVQEIDQLRENQNNYFANLPLAKPEKGIDFTRAAEMSVNAVVHVKTQFNFDQRQMHPLYQFLYGQQKPQPKMGAGSGVIISKEGYIVTNHHVIKGADEIEVTMNNNRSYEAKVVGNDPTTDMAVLKVKTDENLPYIPYGNSDEVEIGEWVLAVGNPYNLTSTVTAGIVSAKARNINLLGNDPYSGASAIESFIQTDAAVNPGNSGGALVNTRGELVGINSAIKSNTGSYTGYSFAVPVNIVQKVVTDLIEYGTVQRAFIGVSIRNLDENLAEKLELQSWKGVYVAGTVEDGAAKKAGIEEGDIITHVSGKQVKSVPELQEQVGQHRPGDKISVTVLREGSEHTFPVTLRNIEGNTEIVSHDKYQTLKTLGAQLEEAQSEELEKLGLNKGVKVKKVLKGKLASIGVRSGYIITKVDHKEVGNVEEVIKILEEKDGGVLLEGVYSNGQRAYYGLEV